MKKINRHLLFLIAAFAAISIIIPAGCSGLKESMLEKVEKDKYTDTVTSLTGSSSTETSDSPQQTSAGSRLDTETATVENDTLQNPDKNPSETDNEKDTQDKVNVSKNGSDNFGIRDIEKQRNFFIKGVEAFQENNYIIAEYYFNQIKDTYFILADHILYYYAKSLLLQDKFELAEENYNKLKNNFPDSVFRQKAFLEYADLFFIMQEYQTAELNYEDFLKEFSRTELAPYCRFQLAVCQEKNNKFSTAIENYKKVWLENPESEYAEKSMAAIQSLAEKKITDLFVPTNNELYGRGEKFFNLYWYESAISEFKKILDSPKISELDPSLEAKTLFKTGMCHFNLRDYSTSRDYLLSGYKKYPAGSFTDDSLYFLGRAETNLDRETQALEYYDDLVKKFPQSNYADDGLYRAGRIYFFRDDLETAAQYYQRIVDQYLTGDRISDAYWELGWIQYKRDDFSNAINTFSSMAERFKGAQLEEKALFWQAKCFEKLGQMDPAIDSYRKIISLNSYSYYTFASQNILELKGIIEKLPAIDTSVYPDNPEIASLLPLVYEGIIKSQYQPQSSDNSGQYTNFTHIDKAKELLLIEFLDSADVEIMAATSEFGKDDFGVLQISTLYLMAKDYINSQKIISENYSKLKNSLSSPYRDYFYYLIYPYGFREYIDQYSTRYGIDPLFVLAVIREESRFNPQAGSYAGALGLMQIIPGTGKAIAGALGIKNFSTDMLLDPRTSIEMGSYYLGKQLENFSQNKYYACGAYNGGPGAMSKWISLYGNRDIDEFIEFVPYDETRNYIKKVMASYYFYQILYAQ